MVEFEFSIFKEGIEVNKTDLISDELYEFITFQQQYIDFLEDELDNAEEDADKYALQSIQKDLLIYVDGKPHMNAINLG